MKAVEKSFHNASDLCSIEISKTKTFTLNRASYFIAKETWVLKQLKNLSVYHFLMTQFSEVLKIC